MKHYQKKESQQGLALLAAVMIVMMFAIMGMMAAQKAKESERIAGANVRYGAVFEAAEKSLRDAARYLGHIQGAPQSGDGSLGRQNAKNFDVSKINQVDIVNKPNSAIIWSKDEIEKVFCGSVNGCTTGINYAAKIDEVLWKSKGITSTFTSTSTGSTTSGSTGSTSTSNNIAGNNYLSNITTYTFIQKLAGGGGDDDKDPDDGAPVAGSGEIGKKSYYLITVKASGFPPNTPANQQIAVNSRENAIVQSVFVRR